MQVNKVNFIRWSDILLDPSLPDAPYAYWMQRGQCDFRPILKAGEATSFYINTAFGLTYPNFQDLRLQLITADGVLIADDIAPLIQHLLPESIVEDPRYNIFSEFITPQGIEYGNHRLRIIRGGTGEVILTSNLLMARTDDARLLETTTYWRFRHDRFFYNIRYHDIPAFYQQFRLGISLVEEQVEGENEVYKEATTGRANLYESVEDKMRKFESYYFDNAAHDAAAIMIKHKFLECNGDLYGFKSGYKRAPDPRKKLTKGEFELYDQSFASINKC